MSLKYEPASRLVHKHEVKVLRQRPVKVVHHRLDARPPPRGGGVSYERGTPVEGWRARLEPRRAALLPARGLARRGHPDADATPQGVDVRRSVERREGRVLERRPGISGLAAGSRVEGHRGLLEQALGRSA